MKTLRFSPIVLASVLLCAAALGSEEDVHPPHRISIWAQAGNGFGEVGATLEVTRPGRDYRIKAISLVVHGKTFAVPASQLKKLVQPRLETAQILTGGSMDGGSPWLLLMFRIGSKGARSATGESKAYVKFRDGRLQGIDTWPIQTD